MTRTSLIIRSHLSWESNFEFILDRNISNSSEDVLRQTSVWAVINFVMWFYGLTMYCCSPTVCPSAQILHIWRTTGFQWFPKVQFLTMKALVLCFTAWCLVDSPWCAICDLCSFQVNALVWGFTNTRGVGTHWQTVLLLMVTSVLAVC